jgi:hypothetical protein
VDVLNKIASVLETQALQAEMDAECVDEDENDEE